MSKRDDILQATLKLIIEGGFQSLTMATILKEAGAGYGTLYNHFKSKDELIFVLYGDLRKKIGHVVLANFDQTASVEDQFKRFVSRYLTYCIENIDEMNFIEQFSYFYADTTTIIGLDDDGFYSTLYEMLQAGQEEGSVKASKLEILIQTVNGAVMSMARGVSGGKFTLTEDDKQDFYRICWDSIHK